MVYARRTDGNHGAIVKALRKVGCRVLDLSRVGKGCPDLLVQLGFKLRFLEVKRPGGRLTVDQHEFHELWRHHVAVVESADDAIREMCK